MNENSENVFYTDFDDLTKMFWKMKTRFEWENGRKLTEKEVNQYWAEKYL